MKRLLDIEFHKFRYSKSSKVLTIIYLVIVVLLMFAGLVEIDVNGIEVKLAELGIFNFPYVYHLSTYIISFLKIFIAIVLVSLTASEYSNRTLKQNLIDGLSKKELVLSKFYLALVLALLTTVLVFFASLSLGFLFSDYTESTAIFSDLEFFLGFFVSHLLFFCFCLFAGILVKKSAFALGFVFVWWIFEGILRLISYVTDLKLDLKTLPIVESILPLESASLLIKEPFSKVSIVKGGIEQLSGEFVKDYGVQWYNVVICLVWCTLFIYWSYALLKRRDL